jgi:hypothetical protein
MTAASEDRVEPQASSPPEDDAVFEAPAVLRLLWADPQFMPEHLAFWSLKHFGPRASSAVERLRASRPEADTDELEAMVIEQQTRVSMAEGAFVGGPFIVLIPVAFCAALLAQAQMAIELAAVNGYAPEDEMRAADLLVLQGALRLGRTQAGQDVAGSGEPPGEAAASGEPDRHGQAHGLPARAPRAGRREAEPAPVGVQHRPRQRRLPGRARTAARLGALHGVGGQKEHLRMRTRAAAC